MAAATVNLDDTLDALKNTPKGRIKYGQYRINVDEDTWIGDGSSSAMASTCYREPYNHRNGIGSDLRSNTNGGPLTINTLYSDEEDEEETTLSSRTYYLDEDNTERNLTSSVNDLDTNIPQPKSQPRVQTPLSCVSAEEVALKELSALFDREMQINTRRKQRAFIDGLEALESECVTRKEEIELMEGLMLDSLEQKWDNELMESKMRYEAELDELNELSRRDQQALNEKLEKLNADNQKEMERRIREKMAAKAREEAALRRIREKCLAVLADIKEAEDKLNGLLNSDVFTQRPATKPFVDSGKAAAAQIHDTVNQLSNRTSMRAIKDLEDCLQSLNTVTERVVEQYRKSEELNRNQEAERQRLAFQRQQSQQQALERQQRQQQQRQQQALERQRSQQQALERQRSQQQALERQRSQQPASEQQQQQTALESQQSVQQTEHDSLFQQSGQPLPPRPLNATVDEASRLEFQRLHGLVVRAKEASKVLAADPQGKKLRMELQKAISITVNAISALNSHHIKEKHQTLSRLMRGENVSVGDNSVSTHGNQAAILFCKNLIARKLVEQADSLVSSNPKAAFPFAAVMVSLMNDSADVKDLILGYLYIQCPYLIPHYPSIEPGQSSEEYHSVLGYKVNASGEIESQSMFIKRVAGFTKLYASCLCSWAVGGQENHSLNMSDAWTYLSKILNIEPYPATTATVLASFLSVCGNKLFQTYGRQAEKLFRFMLQQYLPKAKEARDIDPNGDGGATERLQQILEGLVNGRSLRDPEGYLDQRFWRRHDYY